MTFIALGKYNFLKLTGTAKLPSGAERIVEISLSLDEDLTSIVSGFVQGRKDVIAHLVSCGKVAVPLKNKNVLEMSTRECLPRLADLSPMTEQMPAAFLSVSSAEGVP
jgi:hypothetical protein